MSRTLAHEEASELLPWFVNGTLSEAEHASVGAHVRSCVPCRIALQEQQRLQALLRAQPTVRLSAEPAYERLLGEIGRARTERRHPAGRFAYSFRHAVTAAVLVASLGAASWLVTVATDGGRDGQFVTLTEDGRAGIELDIVLADGVAETELSALVRDFDGSVTAGPDGVGRYRVRIGAGQARRVEDVLERLRDDDRVRFAARAYGEGAGP